LPAARTTPQVPPTSEGHLYTYRSKKSNAGSIRRYLRGSSNKKKKKSWKGRSRSYELRFELQPQLVQSNPGIQGNPLFGPCRREIPQKRQKTRKFKITTKKRKLTSNGHRHFVSFRAGKKNAQYLLRESRAHSRHVLNKSDYGQVCEHKVQVFCEYVSSH
jgi:hypothetical protein